MGRLLGLDVGARRTGLATTDELQIICSPLGTVPTESLITEIEAMHDELAVDAFVLGKPNLIVPSQDHSSGHIDAVAQKIRRRFPTIPIHFVDEGQTSKEASSIQRASGMKKSKRQEKGSLDSIAASLILQRHLDAQAYSRG